MKRSFLLTGNTLLFLLLAVFVHAQSLQPGFNKKEYLELAKISARHGSSDYYSKIPAPEQSVFVYRSPVMGLDNLWDLWIKDRSIAVLSVRGTTVNSVSWLANFYAAMVPATGSLSLAEGDIFNYELADNPRATVHVGWLLSLAYLSRDMMPRIDSCYKKGIKDILVMGHSQGGAIAYLLTAYLYHLQQNGELPKDIRFKTYCSAGPKPGNLYFAYDYEAMTQQGWAYNVVNGADWVPETPISIQTLNDFNTTNPFVNAKAMVKKQKFPANLVLHYAFNRMDKPTRRAQRRYQRYLGNMVYKAVHKHLPDYKAPRYIASSDYVRCGNMIVLQPDADYYKLFPNSTKNVFIHHLFEPYLYLANKQL